MPTVRTGPARVAWIHRHHDPAAPCLLAFKLATEPEPALIKDGSVQPRLGPGISARLPDRPRRRPGHIPYLQIPDYDTRVVFAERRGEFVQMIAPDVANPGVKLLDAGPGPGPVAGELLFAAHGALISRKPLRMALERIHRGDDLAGGQGGEVCHTHIQPGLFRLKLWWCA